MQTFPLFYRMVVGAIFGLVVIETYFGTPVAQDAGARGAAMQAAHP